MARCFNIEFDGINGCDHWDEYWISYTVPSAEEEMIEDVRSGLKELGGGHADIFDAETDELFAEIEV